MVYDLNVLVGVGDRPHSEGIAQGTEVKGGVNWRREVRQASRAAPTDYLVRVLVAVSLQSRQLLRDCPVMLE